MRRTQRLVALLVALMLLAVACSNPTADDRPEDGLEAAAIVYAECMREHGFDWPDPVSVDGSWDIRTPEGIDPDSNEFQDAQIECDQVYQAALPDEKVSPEDRALLEEEMDRMLAFAACMRDQGVDFPDPQFDDDGISGPAGPLDGDWESFEMARVICEEETGESMD
jgi:hypothetical protein